MSIALAGRVQALPPVTMLTVARMLDRVAEAARELERIEHARLAARSRLRALIVDAHAEGIPLATIGRAAGLSRQRIRQIVSASA